MSLAYLLKKERFLAVSIEGKRALRLEIIRNKPGTF
jgi:hypothetical protein